MKVQNLPTTTGGSTSDFIIKNLAAGGTEKITVANLATLMGVVSTTYTEYDAVISQTSTNAPTATVNTNTMSGTPAWSRVSAGVYRLTLTGAFSMAGKTTIQYNNGDNTYISSPNIQRVSANILELNTQTGVDGDILNASINIKTYP